jgi:hypothetical protein
MRIIRKKGESGNTLLEFALVSTFAVPLMVGTFVVGTNLGRSIHATQLSRDAGHMYARGVDFSTSTNQDLIVRLAQGTGMTRTGGNGVVILSRIIKVYQADCDAASLSGSACTNLNQSVVTQRIVVGNPQLRASSFGTPSPSLLDSQGNVANYLKETSARAGAFGNVLSLNQGEIAYTAEVYLPSPDLDFQQYQKSTGVYARSIF